MATPKSILVKEATPRPGHRRGGDPRPGGSPWHNNFERGAADDEYSVHKHAHPGHSEGGDYRQSLDATGGNYFEFGGKARGDSPENFELGAKAHQAEAGNADSSSLRPVGESC